MWADVVVVVIRTAWQQCANIAGLTTASAHRGLGSKRQRNASLQAGAHTAFDGSRVLKLFAHSWGRCILLMWFPRALFLRCASTMSPQGEYGGPDGRAVDSVVQLTGEGRSELSWRIYECLCYNSTAKSTTLSSRHLPALQPFGRLECDMQAGVSARRSLQEVGRCVAVESEVHRRDRQAARPLGGGGGGVFGRAPLPVA